MNARWAVLAGAGSVGSAWAVRTLSQAIPPEVLWALPGAAQVTVGVVAAALITVLAGSMLVAGGLLIFGGEID